MGLGLWALALAHVPGAFASLGDALGLVARASQQAQAAGSDAAAAPTTVVPATRPTTSTSALAAPGYGAATQSGSSLPLRWRVAFARYRTAGATHCATSVIVQNVAPTDTDVQVEAFEHFGTSLALSSEETLSPSQQSAFTTNNDVNMNPFVAPITVLSVPTFAGHVLVYADDPRVVATAYIICRTDDTSDPNAAIVSTTNVPTFPVGQTLEFFRAAVPEVPGYRGEVPLPEALRQQGLDP